MKIESIERIWIDLPLKEIPWRNMVREIPHWSLFELCRVTLSNGVVGVGETKPYYTWGEVTDEAVERAQGQHPAAVMWDDTFQERSVLQVMWHAHRERRSTSPQHDSR